LKKGSQTAGRKAPDCHVLNSRKSAPLRHCSVQAFCRPPGCFSSAVARAPAFCARLPHTTFSKTHRSTNQKIGRLNATLASVLHCSAFFQALQARLNFKVRLNANLSEERLRGAQLRGAQAKVITSTSLTSIRYHIWQTLGATILNRNRVD
jgi:hypothetical protein